MLSAKKAILDKFYLNDSSNPSRRTIFNLVVGWLGGSLICSNILQYCLNSWILASKIHHVPSDPNFN